LAEFCVARNPDGDPSANCKTGLLAGEMEPGRKKFLYLIREVRVDGIC
jgi:hypothetical protein